MFYYCFFFCVAIIIQLAWPVVGMRRLILMQVHPAYFNVVQALVAWSMSLNVLILGAQCSVPCLQARVLCRKNMTLRPMWKSTELSTAPFIHSSDVVY